MTERDVAYHSTASDEVRPLPYVCFRSGKNSHFNDILCFED
jgi:hypothetical protein